MLKMWRFKGLKCFIHISINIIPLEKFIVAVFVKFRSVISNIYLISNLRDGKKFRKF